MMRQPALFFFLFSPFFSPAGHSGPESGLFADSPPPFLMAQTDEFDAKDLEGIEGRGEEDLPPPDSDEGEDGDIPPLEDRGDYEVIDPELEAGLESADGGEEGGKDEDGEADEPDEGAEGDGGDEDYGDEGDDEGGDGDEGIFEEELNKEEDPDVTGNETQGEPPSVEEMEPVPGEEGEDAEPVFDEQTPLQADDEGEGGDLNLITNIRYIAGEDMIVIDGTKTVFYKAKRNTANNQLVIEILQARMMDNLQWPYVLKDFNTNFGMIQADQKMKTPCAS